MAYLMILFSTVFLTAFSCKERKPMPAVKKEPFVYVQKKLQDELRADLKKIKSNETIYALFSSSGWSDAGQFVIRNGVLHHATPNSKNFTEIVLDSAKIDYLNRQIDNWTRYENYNPKIMDGVRYNFVHMTVKEGKITEHKKLFMNNPGVNRDGENKRYQEIADFFINLPMQEGVTL